MTALLLSFGILGYFTLVGRALHQALRPSTRLAQGWLLSPALGFGVIVLLVTILNQAGWPIGRIGPVLLVATTGLSLFVLLRQRAAFPGPLLRLYALCIGLVMLTCGWPMILYGFHWVSFGNADMGYYCLGADRILRNGFYALPTAHDLAGYDWAQTLWFNVPTRARFGTEVLIASVASVTPWSCTQVFMPATLALAGVQASAAIALVVGLPKRHAVGLLTGLFLVFGPLFQLGLFYQLNSQVGGLGLLFAACALSHRALYLRRTRHAVLRHGVTLGVILGTLAVFYPEISPFGAIVSVGLLVWGLIKFPAQRVRYLKFIGVLSACCLLLLRGNLLSALIAITVQAKSGFTNTDLSVTLFPYLIVPSGIANLLGFLAIPLLPPAWLLNLMIVGGFVLLVLSVLVAAKKTWRGEPWAWLLLTMLVVGIRLFKGDNDFGLFKLAMYCQPVLMAALACLAVETLGQRAWLAALAFCAATAPACWNYGYASCGLRSGSFAELPWASKLGSDIPREFNPGDKIVSDITNNTGAALAASQLQGTDTVFLSKYFFLGGALRFKGPLPDLDLRLHPELFAQSLALEQELSRHRRLAQLFGTTFSQPVTGPADPAAKPAEWLLRVNRQFNLLNRSRPGSDGPRYFVLEPLSQLQNYLVFIDSSKGNHYFLGDQRKISYYAQESDYFSPSSAFFGLGRFLLFQVLQPDEEFYLKVSLSRTVMGAGKTRLPENAAVYGETTQPLPLPGSGAASVIVGPIRPRMLGGSAYIAIDFGENGSEFLNRKPGLMTLYNSGVSFDHRRMVGFGRDISLLSQAKLDHLARPRQLARFPRDLLASPGIEFSGIYEDGWVSQHAYVTLAQARANECLRFKGIVPSLGGMAEHLPELTVLINQVAVGTYPIAPGEFDLKIPLPRTAAVEAKTRIELVFSQAGNLLSPDDRPVSAKIDFLGLSQP